jgi:hypothetical protein
MIGRKSQTANREWGDGGRRGCLGTVRGASGRVAISPEPSSGAAESFACQRFSHTPRARSRGQTTSRRNSVHQPSPCLDRLLKENIKLNPQAPSNRRTARTRRYGPGEVGGGEPPGLPSLAPAWSKAVLGSNDRWSGIFGGQGGSSSVVAQPVSNDASAMMESHGG